jgi:hypothetical protein
VFLLRCRRADCARIVALFSLVSCGRLRLLSVPPTIDFLRIDKTKQHTVFVAYHEAGHAVASCQLVSMSGRSRSFSHRYGGGKHVAQGGIPKDSLIPRLTLEPTYRQIALRMDATSPFPVIKHSDFSGVARDPFFFRRANAELNSENLL